jgi:hypothetical protein
VKAKATQVGNATIFEHPAQGSISTYRLQARSIELFGSALNHQHVIGVEISTVDVHREYHQDRHTNQKHLIRFEMSEAQWASFVSSVGSSAGTPITFRYRPPAGELISMPTYECEGLKDRHSAEIKKQAQQMVDDSIKGVKELQALLAGSGTVSKTQLRAVTDKLAIALGNLPSNMAFMQDMFAEAMEKSVEDAKSEVQAYTNSMIRNAGIGALTVNTDPQLGVNQREDD